MSRDKLSITKPCKTRCTPGDVRSFFCTSKRICIHKTNFLRMYSNIVLQVILNCMNMQIATQLIIIIIHCFITSVFNRYAHLICKSVEI